MIGHFASDHIKLRAIDYMATQVVIYRPSSQLFNETTGMTTSGTEKVIYRGMARIWDSSGPNSLGFGESDMVLQSTYASIPWDTSPVPRRDDVVYIIDPNPLDELLQGRSYRILEVETGGQFRATRRLSIQRLEESRHWEDTE